MEICELSMRINQQRTCLFDILAFMRQIAQILFRRFRINGSFFVQFVRSRRKLPGSTADFIRSTKLLNSGRLTGGDTETPAPAKITRLLERAASNTLSGIDTPPNCILNYSPVYGPLPSLVLTHVPLSHVRFQSSYSSLVISRLPSFSRICSQSRTNSAKKSIAEP